MLCNVMAYSTSLGVIFSTVKTGSQEEEQTNKDIIKGEDLCHHGPLPGQSRHSKHASSQYCSRNQAF